VSWPATALVDIPRLEPFHTVGAWRQRKTPSGGELKPQAFE
jgi:hypothetical protein